MFQSDKQIHILIASAYKNLNCVLILESLNQLNYLLMNLKLIILKKKRSLIEIKKIVLSSPRIYKSNKCLLMIGIMFLASQSVLAQTRVVTGTVSDKKGIIPGVSVVVKGSVKGTVTDLDGAFKIANVKTSDILIFSYLGYEIRDILAGNSNELKVILKENLSELDEVVVIGFGTQKTRNITSAVSIVGEEDLALRPNTQVGSLINGKTTGVIATPGSGQPGQGISLNIRGASSLGDQQPLYVVDGIIISDTRSINPADVDKISILKDAASAAIYGAQGANGVVLITTKLGKKGSAPTITFNTYGGISEIAKTIDVLKARQYQDLMADLGFNTIWSRFPYNTNWQDKIFQQGLTQNHQLAITGASENTRYYISGTLYEEIGAVVTTKARRTNFKVNLDQDLNDWLKVGTRITYNNYSDVSVNDTSSGDRGGVIIGALVSPPVISKFNPDGSFSTNPFQVWENPFASAEGIEREYRTREFTGNAFAELKFLKDFTFKSSFSVQQRNEDYNEFIDPLRTDRGRSYNGRATSTRGMYQFIGFDNTITYKKKYKDHNFEVLAGIITQDYRFENQSIAATDFISGQIGTVGAGNLIRPNDVDTNISEQKNIAYISRLDYSFQDKYLFTASLRRDGSSVFGPDNRYGYFPSASAGWRLSKEKFLSDKNWLADLKLRASWGVNGNDPINPYSYFGLVKQGANYPIGTQGGQYPINIENRTLKWEETTQFNFGLDFSILRGRISSSFDIYRKQANDVLFTNNPIPTSTGFSSAAGNALGLKNEGFEFLLNTINIDGKFKWTSNFNLSINRNEVTTLTVAEIPEGNIAGRGAATVTRLNQPTSQFFGYVFSGVDPANGRSQYLTKDNQLTYTPNAEDRRIIGDPNPDFVYGFTNTFSYKGFELSVFLQGREGNDMINATRFDTEAMNSPNNQSAVVLNRWRNPGDITNVPGISQIGNIDNSIISSRFVEDASYLRVKAVTLSYNLPSDLLKKVKFKGVTIYATAENLLTVTDYSGLDPEVNTFGANALAQGIDYGTFPQTRKLILGLNISL
ncbi:MAG: TonB-linked SusC/RagA family outer membrane protein [bacterium]|jgi:TonB-linked SusC/RagA family outer membrane protein